MKFWNFDGEGKNQASGCYENLILTSKAKTVKGDSKNTINERGILNGSLAGVFVILLSLRVGRGCDLKEISQHEERMGLVEAIKLINYQG